jgi:serine/threonine protein kinase/ankyrin repeat protein
VSTIENLQRLLLKGVDVNKRDNAGRTPLHIAVSGYSNLKIKLVAYLLENGADKELCDNDGYCPFLYAICKEQLDAVKYFVERYPQEKYKVDRFVIEGTKIHANDADVSKTLVGVVHKNNGDGTYDIAYGEDHIIKTFLAHNLELRTGQKKSFLQYGRAALHLAAEGRQNAMHDGSLLNYLIDQGLDLNIASNDGNTPIHVAAQSGYPKVVAALLNHIGTRLDPTLKNVAGKTFVDVMKAADRLSWLASSSAAFTLEHLSAFNHFLWFAMVQTEPPQSDAKLDMYDLRNYQAANVAGLTLTEQYALLHRNLEALVAAHPELAQATDVNGRSALEVASKPFKTLMQSVLLWHGRYRITEARPEHMSATCYVFKAVDERTVDLDGHSLSVALKLMRNGAQFRREVAARDRGFAAEYVVNVLATYPAASLPSPVPLPLPSPLSSPVTSQHAVGKWGNEVGQMGQVEQEVGEREMDLDSTGQLTKANAERLYLLVMPLADRNLFVALKQERWAGKSMEEVRHVFVQLTHCVEHMHQKGVLHADLKPLNMVRTAGQWKLIDLDAACEIGTEPVGHKSSSAYVPPEAVYVDAPAGTACVRSVTAVQNGHASYELLTAHPSFDVWSLGAILYQMSNADVRPLFQGDQDDNLSTDPTMDDNLPALADWTKGRKDRKLGRVGDQYARNLLAQMLHRDPLKRPSLTRVLAHPFLSGRKVARLVGEKAKYDVFLSYRVASDSAHVERLYALLTAQGFKVYWDKLCLEPGVDWEQGTIGQCRCLMHFVLSLNNPTLFTPHLSHLSSHLPPLFPSSLFLKAFARAL